MAVARGVFIVAAKRTAFGTYGGKLKNSSCVDMAVVAAQGALQAGNVNPEIINSVVFGNVMQSSPDASYLSRHVGLKAGIPNSVPALTVNRLCGSGFQAIISGAQEIRLGEREVVLVGGTESMSQLPFAVWGMRFGTTFGQEIKLQDTLWSGMTDTYVGLTMAITAENLAEKYNITRQECDECGFQSQTRWKAANDAGKFKDEIVPMTVKGKKGPEEFAVDEHPRQATLEKMATLPPVFKKGGTVTAGTASGICDGAAALVLASEEALSKHKLTPLARLVSYGIAGCDPSIMGIGPVPATQEALKAAGKTIQDMDVVEVNEAFAAQYLSVAKELGLDPAKSNLNGGGIAIGHPLGATGARITANLTHELRRTGGKFALGSACIGGGQGITVIIERV